MDKLKILNLARMIAKFSEISTDKGTLISDGELAVGVEVFVEVDGELAPAEDGKYTQENGDVIVVAEGKVAEIRKAEEPENTEETVEEEVVVENSAKEKFEAVKAKFEASYQEIEANIYAALADAGVYGYLLENGDDYAIVSEWGEDEKEHLYRYAISIDENGFVNLGEKVEVRIEYVPINEPEPEPEQEEEFSSEGKDPENEQKEEFNEVPAFKDEQNEKTEATLSLAEVARKIRNK